MKTYYIPEQYRHSQTWLKKISQPSLYELLHSPVCVIPRKVILQEISRRQYIVCKRKKFYRKRNFKLIYLNPIFNFFKIKQL